MGLIVDDNGHYRGWLASILCCCAALTEDEYPAERKQEQATRPAFKELQYQQQPALTALPIPPDTTHASAKVKVDPDLNSLHDSQRSGSSRLSKPHTFDPESILPIPTANAPEQPDPELVHSTTNDSLRTHRHIRPSRSGSIRRQALVPLPLGPVVLRDASDTTQDEIPSTRVWNDERTRPRHRRSESTQALISNTAQQSHVEQREYQHQRDCRCNTGLPGARISPQEGMTRSLTEPAPTLPKATSSPSLSNSFKHHARDDSSSSTLVALAERPRDGARLQRKRSNQSKSSLVNAGDSDVEKEVLELNTIVEERRLERNKQPAKDSQHVPAVAPSMQVGARSETLNDIGSALSRPLTVHRIGSNGTTREPDSREFQPTSARVSGWLSSVTTSIASSVTTSITASAATLQPSTTADGVPFYGCHAGAAHNRNDSASSSRSGLGSVSYALESSPATSKRYSRRLMITPLTPLDGGAGLGDDGRVGIAL